MKKYLKDILRELLHQKLRAFYIFVMILLAVATYVGLNLTHRNISITLNQYKQENSLYDLKIIGHISNDVLDKIKENKDIIIEPGFLDYFNINNNATVANISTINDRISPVSIISGRNIEKYNEILISQLNNSYNIGDIITVYKKDPLQMRSIKDNKLKIVGIYENPEYISASLKEVVNLGESSVNTFILANNDLFNLQTPNIYRVQFKDLSNIKITDKNFQQEVTRRVKNFKAEYELPKENIYQTIADNTAIMGFRDSINTLNMVKILFPVIFFMIVILVCTTNITRLILDQTRIMGTYLFLGYNNKIIYLKYLLIALIPTLIAIPLGVLIGIYFLPRIIYKAFSADYISNLQTLKITLNGQYVTTAIIISILCILFSIFLSVRRILKMNIVQLLLGGMEIPGNKILLEKIPFIWKKVSFKNKITLRNLIRYKVRMIMSILGIAGCASLMFLGFGMKEAYSNIIVKSKYIRNVDYNIIYGKDHTNILDLISKMDTDNKYIIDDVYTENISIKDSNLADKNVTVTIFNEPMKNIKLIDENTDKVIKIEDGGIYITKRLFSQLHSYIGEYVELKINNISKYYKINGVVDNYLSNYIYMTKNTYRKVTDENIENNTFLVNVKGENTFDLNRLYKEDNVISIFNENILYKAVTNVTNSINTLVIIISILSISLCLVVSLNLMSINISERKKEISTLKVLGFTNFEATMYIFKELILINIFSLLIGFYGGHLLMQNIIGVLRDTNVVFITKYNYKPFLFTSILITMFTIFVAFLLANVIRKIDMVEALKSNE